MNLKMTKAIFYIFLGLVFASISLFFVLFYGPRFPTEPAAAAGALRIFAVLFGTPLIISLVLLRAGYKLVGKKKFSK